MSANLNKLTVPELRKQLVTSGLPVTGRKADLVQRLREVEKGQSGGQDSVEDGKEKNEGNIAPRMVEKKKKLKTEASTKKEKGGSASQVKKCVANCKAGRNSGCPIKARGRGKASNNVGCVDIDRMLEALGVDPKTASLCTKAAIMRGHIKLSGEEGDLEQVVHEDKGECGHLIKATLGDLLKQPDYSNYDYDLKNVTVICKKCGEDNMEGRTYVTNICEGEPRFDDGKFHNHCTKCPGFGMCIDDYREVHCDRCGHHYFAGSSGGFPCSNCKRKSWEAKFKGPAGQEHMKKIALYLAGEGEKPSDYSSEEEFY